MFPYVEILLEYADEDSGSNTGRLKYKAGQAIESFMPKSQSKEAYDIYFDRHPGTSDMYKLINNQYEYVGEE